MPAVNSFVTDWIKGSVRPGGWRGIPVLRRALAYWPYFTGSRVRFLVTIEARGTTESVPSVNVHGLSLFREDACLDTWEATSEEKLDEPYQIHLGSTWIARAGSHWIGIRATETADGEASRDIEQPLAGFEVLSIDSLALFLASILVGFVVGFMSIGGVWLLDVLRNRDNEPLRVIIVEPASQSETSSNAE